MNWKRRLYYALGPKSRRTFRKLYYFPIDMYEGLTGKRDELTPPRGKIYIGPGDFKAIGEKLKNDFIKVGGLQPGHRVLDIGCGIGRIAGPLTSYLKGGSYEGFDVVEEGIVWCKQVIGKKYSNFKFQYVELRNDLYNLETGNSASEFKFPYANDEFDFVILTSVFTHMQENDVDHYLSEIGRVMKKGGVCFATFFIIDEHSKAFLKTASDPFFKYDHGHYYLHDEKVRDANIAYTSEWVQNTCVKHQLHVKQHHRGWWCGGNKKESVDFQDVMIISK